jgi:hypothetical protein
MSTIIYLCISEGVILFFNIYITLSIFHFVVNHNDAPKKEKEKQHKVKTSTASTSEQE